jgi:hypothetical protein
MLEQMELPQQKNTTTQPLNQNKMNKEDIGFCIVYIAFSITALVIALTYWYNELFKKN